MTRPTALTVHADDIPNALRAERRWVVWRYELRNSRWAKIPCTASGDHAKTNDPSTWTTFDLALAAYQAGGFDGIGFVLGDGWAGIDLDHCIEGTVVSANSHDVIRRLDDCGDGCVVYQEVSPSGTGYKAIGRCRRIGGQIDFAVSPPAHTTWQGARFFAITGHLPAYLDPPYDPTIDISDLIDDWFPAQRLSSDPSPRPDYIKEGDTRGTENIDTRSDDDVLLAAATATNREKFLTLFRGDLSGCGDDRSRADQALVTILVYWCSGDLDQADRLFRQSALMRDKWETRSYRLATLQKALALFQRGLSQ